MKLNWKKWISLCAISLIFLFACSGFKSSDKLTVSMIHDRVIFGKTTVGDLKDMFGKETKYIGSNEAQEIYRYWNNSEGGLNYMLEDNTDYWETLRFDKKADTFSYKEFDGCYEYSGDNLSVKSVYFFVIDSKVYDIKFNGSITDESVAKKDKYLRQILD
ncbi:hypothetical protein DDV21_004725 [Streptococcus chenjunshii]|uniref:Lipoprotein n=1 Tax=Streptococcus chenjunshii TaxID=2173853 RepID=A0A372KJE4_9STRE|nr:hypothetical protein [Streptococcus chenjunshii]AXQ78430.1 hypothetical protein DDV21_004725 [Streptococcus chenjunshii]RFU49934.1 hypothetical protein DDV22_11320 [Streptococcus chenjunshii]RFU52126.1 hypothetical protein DDV23_11340 [Streptococcus chenjunshii]